MLSYPVSLPPSPSHPSSPGTGLSVVGWGWVGGSDSGHGLPGPWPRGEPAGMGPSQTPGRDLRLQRVGDRSHGLVSALWLKTLLLSTVCSACPGPWGPSTEGQWKSSGANFTLGPGNHHAPAGTQPRPVLETGVCSPRWACLLWHPLTPCRALWERAVLFL